MKKRKNIMPKDFGNVLQILIGVVIENGYQEELCNIQGELFQKYGLVELLASKDKTGETLCNKVLGCSQSILALGLMIGYAFGQWYPLDHPKLTKDLDYLFSRMPGLKKEETVFFTRDVFLKKLGDLAEDKNIATITQHEIEKAAAAIVLCWPKNQEAIKEMAGKIREGFESSGKKVA